MLRHGYLTWPVEVREVTIGEVRTLYIRSYISEFANGGAKGMDKTDGIWILQDPDKKPDVALYYVHGETGPVRNGDASSLSTNHDIQAEASPWAQATSISSF